MANRRLILHYNLGTQGAPWSACRHPDSHVERVTDIQFYLEQAWLAERGCFESVFIVDSQALFPTADAPCSGPWTR